jgi:hypothetical protein
MQIVLYIVLFLLILFFSLKRCVESYSLKAKWGPEDRCEGTDGYHFFDRHPVDCGNDLIHRWDFQSVPDRVDGKCRSYVECVEHTKQRHSTINMKTDWKDGGNMNVGNLDKSFNIECGDMPIQYFRLGNKYNPNKFRFDYKCGKVPMKNCTEHSTPAQDTNGGRIDWLNRHNVQCPGKKALSKLKYVYSGNPGHYYYKFRCCDPEDG